MPGDSPVDNKSKNLTPLYGVLHFYKIPQSLVWYNMLFFARKKNKFIQRELVPGKLHTVFCSEWYTQVSLLVLLLAVRGNEMLQTSDWKPSLTKPQLPVKDVYSTSRLPKMEKLLRRPNDQFFTVLTLKRKQNGFQKTLGYLLLAGQHNPALSLSYLTFRGLQVIARHNVNEEVKLVKLCYGHGNVVPLKT